MAAKTDSPSYEAGQRCFRDGKRLSDNPHFPYGRRDHESTRGDEWDDGWWDAYWGSRKEPLRWEPGKEVPDED